MRQAIGSSSRPTPDTIQMRTIFSPDSEFWVRELGIWAGSTLFALWSTSDAGKPLGYCTPGVDWVFSHRFSLRELPPGSINIVVDKDAASLMGIILAHEQDTNAHGIASHLAVVLKSLADANRISLGQADKLAELTQRQAASEKKAQDLSLDLASAQALMQREAAAVQAQRTDQNTVLASVLRNAADTSRLLLQSSRSIS
jgi:hypothetical protein